MPDKYDIHEVLEAKLKGLIQAAEWAGESGKLSAELAKSLRLLCQRLEQEMDNVGESWAKVGDVQAELWTVRECTALSVIQRSKLIRGGHFGRVPIFRTKGDLYAPSISPAAASPSRPTPHSF